MDNGLTSSIKRKDTTVSDKEQIHSIVYDDNLNFKLSMVFMYC